jgi:predicted nucleotidyltransferase
LSIFNANRIKYLIIGGHAVSEYSEPRYTKDLDIWVEPSEQNANLVFQSLKQFGAPLFELSPSDFAEKDSFYQMGRPPVRIDILMSIQGLVFEKAWENRNMVPLFGETVPLISLDDLIVAKRSAGRPQDLIDLDSLLLTKKIKRNS